MGLKLKVAPKLSFKLLFIKTQLFIAFLYIKLHNNRFLVGFEEFENVFSNIEVCHEFDSLIEEFEQKIVFFLMNLRFVGVKFFIFFGLLLQFFRFLEAKLGLYLLLLLKLVMRLLILIMLLLKRS